MPRCFAAVEVAAPHVRRALESAQFSLKQAFGPLSPVKWVPSHQFHFTLKFFGEIPAEAVERAAGALRQVAAESGRFRLEAAGLGCFPDASRPSVLWSGLGEGKSHLTSLAQRVEEAMAADGFPREARPFKPHLTLGRVREGARVPQAVADLLRRPGQSYGSWVVERMVLMRSDLLPAGPRYTILHEAPLRSEEIGQERRPPI